MKYLDYMEKYLGIGILSLVWMIVDLFYECGGLLLILEIWNKGIKWIIF